MNNHKNVISEIVAHELCVGCGCCAGVCPSNFLEMKWQENGDLAPHLIGSCPPKCRVCLQVCPFDTNNQNEDLLAEARFAGVSGIKHRPEVGFCLSTFSGYSKIHREKGASGGMTTWLLEQMLINKHVDAVVCVGPSIKKDRLFSFQILNDVRSLRNAAGSRYYPVDICDALASMNAQNAERRYAVVGLPCVLKGLHLAMGKMPRLRRRVVYTVGLVCGHLPNRFYTEYLSRLSGVELLKVETVDYRCKENTTRASNFKFRAVSKDGYTGIDVPFSRISNIWVDGYFQYNACNYCDDVFAEVADVVLMDAWLPEYVRNPKGHSLIIVRHPDLLEILRKGQSNGICHLESLTVSKVVESQRGVIENKRLQICGRLYAAMQRSERVPTKRVSPDRTLYHKHRKVIEARRKIQEMSKLLWMRAGYENLALFRWRLFALSIPIVTKRFFDRMHRILKNPWLPIIWISRRFRKKILS